MLKRQACIWQTIKRAAWVSSDRLRNQERRVSCAPATGSCGPSSVFVHGTLRRGAKTTTSRDRQPPPRFCRAWPRSFGTMYDLGTYPGAAGGRSTVLRKSDEISPALEAVPGRPREVYPQERDEYVAGDPGFGTGRSFLHRTRSASLSSTVRRWSLMGTGRDDHRLCDSPTSLHDRNMVLHRVAGKRRIVE